MHKLESSRSKVGGSDPRTPTHEDDEFEADDSLYKAQPHREKQRLRASASASLDAKSVLNDIAAVDTVSRI